MGHILFGLVVVVCVILGVGLAERRGRIDKLDPKTYRTALFLWRLEAIVISAMFAASFWIIYLR